MVIWVLWLIVSSSSVHAQSDSLLERGFISGEAVIEWSDDPKKYKTLEAQKNLILSLEYLVSSQPTNGMFWYNLGQALLTTNECDRAKDAFEKVIQLKSPLTLAAKVYSVKALVCRDRIQEVKPLVSEIFKLEKGEKANDWAQARVGHILKERHEQVLESALPVYQKGEFAQAEKLADSSLIFYPSAEGYLMLAISQIKQGKTDEGKENLYQALSYVDGGPVEHQIRLLISEISKRERDFEAPWGGTLEFASGYNSNINASPYYFPIQGVPFYRLFGSLAYRVPSIEWGSLQLEYVPYVEETSQYPDYRFISQAFYARATKDWGRWSFTLTPSIEHQHLGKKPYLLIPNVDFRTVRSFRSSSLGLSLSARYQKSQNGALSYLSGYSYSARPYYSSSGRIMDWRLGLTYLQDQFSDLEVFGGLLVFPIANRSAGAELNFYVHPNDLWTFQAGLSYLKRFFTRNTQYLLEVAPGLYTLSEKMRIDDITTLTLSVRRRFFDHFEAYVTYMNRHNGSTIGRDEFFDKNYRQSTVMLGISWGMMR